VFLWAQLTVDGAKEVDIVVASPDLPSEARQIAQRDFDFVAPRVVHEPRPVALRDRARGALLVARHGPTRYGAGVNLCGARRGAYAAEQLDDAPGWIEFRHTNFSSSIQGLGSLQQ